jgi:hypothetical protein
VATRSRAAVQARPRIRQRVGHEHSPPCCRMRSMVSSGRAARDWLVRTGRSLLPGLTSPGDRPLIPLFGLPPTSDCACKPRVVVGDMIPPGRSIGRRVAGRQSDGRCECRSRGGHGRSVARSVLPFWRPMNRINFSALVPAAFPVLLPSASRCRGTTGRRGSAPPVAVRAPAACATAW